jgi:MoxR-like ATPase
MTEKFEDLFRGHEEKKEPIYKFKKMVKSPEGAEEREFVSVGGTEIEVNTEGRGTQFGAAEFADFALDAKTLDLLQIYAKAIKLNQPPLIEGTTDIGKSKALEYLAFLTNNFLIYQSFSGQTDVSELIGKYVPNTEDARKTFERTLAQKNRGALKPETLAIIEKASNEKEPRGLFEDECHRIAELEGLSFERIEWVWQDGTVPKAMEFNGGKGAWLYFDELGAAEPQILVKLNRIFARGVKRIEITENGGREVFGGENFRLIATTNPPSYAGREPFEKDFLRRWVYQKVSGLNQKDFKARLDFAGLKSADKGGRSDIFGRKEINELLNDLIASFAFLSQAYLDKIPKEHGEQQFRLGDFTDALRVAEYLRILGADDLIGALKEAVEFYYIGKIDENKTDTEDKNVRDKLRDILKALIDKKNAERRLEELLADPEIVRARAEIKGKLAAAEARARKLARESAARKGAEGEAGEKVTIIEGKHERTNEKGEKIEEEIEIDLEKRLEEMREFYKNNKVDWIELPEKIGVTEEQAKKMKEQIEKFGFNWAIIIPEGLVGEPEMEEYTDKDGKKKKRIKEGSNKEYKKLHELMSKGYNATNTGDNYDKDGKFEGTQDKRKGLRIILTRKDKELGDNLLFAETKNKSAKELEDWIKEGKTKDGTELKEYGLTGITESEYLVMQREYYEEKTREGKTGDEAHIDVIDWTWFLESGRPVLGRVPFGGWYSVSQSLDFSSDGSAYRHVLLGGRLAGSFEII